MSSKGQHVVPRDGGWSVRKGGSDRVTRTFQTQKEAISYGRSNARSQGTELYIHGRDGRIRDRETYSSDPKTTKG